MRKLRHACVAYAPVDLDGQVGIVVDIISDDASQWNWLEVSFTLFAGLRVYFYTLTV